LAVIGEESLGMPLLNGSIEEHSGQGPAPLSIGFSILIHACVLSLIAGARGIQLPKPQSAYQQMIQGKEHKLVWYHFKEKLPEIKPAQSHADHRPLRAEVKIPNQSIVSAPKMAPKAPQMIWQKAPEINTDIQFKSPNLVAVNLPKVAPPKEFVPPVPQAKKVLTPQIEAPAPPQIDATKTPEVAKRVELKEVARPWRDFKPPPARPKAGPPQVSYVDPSPSLTAAATAPKNPDVEQFAEARLEKVYRPFEAPKADAKAGKPGVAVPVLPSPPPADAAGNSPELNVVVVGLNPVNELPAVPPVSRPAAFSAGPKVNPKGGTGDGNSAAALSVPDLTIRSGNIDTRSTIMARNTIPNSMRPPNPADALREAAKYITVDEVGRATATRVANAPDSRFDGRAVYMMAVQMPNITSYVGSWLMWYSEHNARPEATSSVSAPVVHRKVDPKYVAAAVSERVEGTVRLAATIRKDGTVGAVELVHGLDARLDRSAEEALAKWQFGPAMRNGEPVDVDILVEIPFRLKPRLE
jgi:TonB family protein